MLETIKEYFIERYKKLDEMTETIQNNQENPFLNDNELKSIEEQRRMLEDVESSLEEWILEQEENDWNRIRKKPKQYRNNLQKQIRLQSKNIRRRRKH